MLSRRALSFVYTMVNLRPIRRAARRPIQGARIASSVLPDRITRWLTHRWFRFIASMSNLLTSRGSAITMPYPAFPLIR